MSEKLTFGEDHSEGAAKAWGWVTAQTWTGWNLDVIAVDSRNKSANRSVVLSASGYDSLRLSTSPTTSPSSTDHQRELPAKCGFNEVRYLTASNDPRLVLSECPDSTLLVVGARGKGLMKALHIGSTTEWLMQCPNTPLLIARSPVRTERILMCIDGSTHADAAVELLTHFPWIDATNISVLSVIEADNDVRASAEAAALRLEATGAKVEMQIVSPDPESITTNTRASILEMSEQLQPDLIVMGTRGLTGLPRLRVGSVASAIAHHSGSSVLLVRDLHEDDQGGVSLEGP